jgi:hypothetical protein
MRDSAGPARPGQKEKLRNKPIWRKDEILSILSAGLKGQGMTALGAGEPGPCLVAGPGQAGKKEKLRNKPI